MLSIDVSFSPSVVEDSAKLDWMGRVSELALDAISSSSNPESRRY
jgi:hypothetical protein